MAEQVITRSAAVLTGVAISGILLHVTSVALCHGPHAADAAQASNQPPAFVLADESANIEHSGTNILGGIENGDSSGWSVDASAAVDISKLIPLERFKSDVLLLDNSTDSAINAGAEQPIGQQGSPLSYASYAMSALSILRLLNMGSTADSTAANGSTVGALPDLAGSADLADPAAIEFVPPM